MNVTPKGGIFRDGQLHKQIRRETRRNRMFALMWTLKRDRRQLLHNGRKP